MTVSVLPEKILETQLRRIRLGHEIPLRSASFDESPSRSIGLRPTQFVERYLEEFMAEWEGER